MKSFLLTCEHAVNTIPDQFRHLFIGAENVLETHQSIDLGARSMASVLSQRLSIPLFTGEVSRLLIELNRSIGHHQLFSKFTEVLPETEKSNLINSYYKPYRSRVKQWIDTSLKPVVHLSIHSFTPVFNGISRDVDIGLLFDPERKFESDCCSILLDKLKHDLADLQIRYNEPYRGVDDGFTTYLRTQYHDQLYAGIEIEVNQKYMGTEKFNFIQFALTDAVNALQQNL